MVVDAEVKEILDKHGNLLDMHGNEITQLKISQIRMEERFNTFNVQMNVVQCDVSDLKQDLKNGLAKIENTMLVNFNSLLDYKKNENNNQTDIIKTDKSNNTQIIIKVLGIISILLLGVLLGDKVNLNNLIPSLFQR